MQKIKEKAFILKCSKYREADLIVKAFNSSGSQISLLARSALKSKKRFGGGVLEPTHYVDLTYSSQSKDGQLMVLEEAQLVESFPELRKDYGRLEQALLVVEVVLKASQENDVHNTELFNLIGNALRSLEKVPSSENFFSQFRLHFCLKFLFQQGVLEPEQWMKDYLQTSMVNHSQLGKHLDSKLSQHRVWVESRLQEYLSTGTLSSLSST